MRIANFSNELSCIGPKGSDFAVFVAYKDDFQSQDQAQRSALALAYALRNYFVVRQVSNLDSAVLRACGELVTHSVRKGNASHRLSMVLAQEHPSEILSPDSKNAPSRRSRHQFHLVHSRVERHDAARQNDLLIFSGRLSFFNLKP